MRTEQRERFISEHTRRMGQMMQSPDPETQFAGVFQSIGFRLELGEKKLRLLFELACNIFVSRWNPQNIISSMEVGRNIIRACRK